MTTNVSEKATLPTATKLEIGSGNKPKPGYLHFDIRPDIGADVVGDAKKLPFPDNTFEEVFSRFFLEHLLRADIKVCLKEMFRVLKKDGTVVVIVPNLAYFCKLFIEEKGQKKEWALNKMYGFEKYAEDHHNFGFDAEILEHYLKEAGFTNIVRVQDMDEQYLHMEAKKV